MLQFEIRIWIILSGLVSILPVLYVFKLILLFFWFYLKLVFNKIQYKRNLMSIKKEFIKREIQSDRLNGIEEDIYETNSSLDQKLIDKYASKLARIKFEALVLKEKGDIIHYEKKLNEGLAIDPENLEFLKLIGNFYFNLGNIKKALPILKKILEKEISNHKTIWQLGQIYLEKGDYETAKLLITKAIEYKNDNPKYYISLAEILYSMDNLKEAIDYMLKALKLRPSNISYLLAIASIYEDTGELGEARKYYYKVLELEPMNEIAKEKINNN